MSSREIKDTKSRTGASTAIDPPLRLPNDIELVDPARLPDLSELPFFMRKFVAVASKIHWGSLVMILPDGRAFRFQGLEPGSEGVLHIHDLAFAKRLLRGGTIGVAESYFEKQWSSPDVTTILEVVSRNGDHVSAFFNSNFIIRLAQRFLHFLRKNTTRGAKRNIMAHYDMGNEFYAEWLDPTMTYSAARFNSADQDLSQAQINKYRSLAERIDLQPEHHVLEIGSGWGGFAEYAATEIGCRVTGITISPEQLNFAKERIANQGLEDKVDFRLQDYRKVEGTFDRIASIEMFEAVGIQYWPVYFKRLFDCLKPGGLAGLQIITIADRHFEDYKKRTDFIQKYIFPGGMLPSPTALRAQVEKAGLMWKDNINFGPDYARTLKTWQARFLEAWPRIQSMGFDERFRLLWRYYLAYCEAGFRSGSIDVTQISLTKTDNTLTA